MVILQIFMGNKLESLRSEGRYFSLWGGVGKVGGNESWILMNPQMYSPLMYITPK